jgi:hypothetical protein
MKSTLQLETFTKMYELLQGRLRGSRRLGSMPEKEIECKTDHGPHAQDGEEDDNEDEDEELNTQINRARPHTIRDLKDGLDRANVIGRMLNEWPKVGLLVSLQPTPASTSFIDVTLPLVIGASYEIVPVVARFVADYAPSAIEFEYANELYHCDSAVYAADDDALTLALADVGQDSDAEEEEEEEEEEGKEDEASSKRKECTDNEIFFFVVEDLPALFNSNDFGSNDEEDTRNASINECNPMRAIILTKKADAGPPAKKAKTSK